MLPAIENLHQRNSAFSSKQPGLQLYWDSTSLSLFKTCPRKYYYKMILGMVTRHERLPLVFGIHLHKACERYDAHVARGATHDEAQEYAVHQALIDTKGWVPEDAEGAKYRSRETLVRAIVWYTEHFREDIYKTVVLPDGRPAVELSFKIDLPFTSGDGEQFFYSGHLDKVVEDQLGNWWVLDHKTTKSSFSNFYFSQYSPNIQISAYTFAAKIVLPKAAEGVIISALQLGVNFTRFAREQIPRNHENLDEWYGELQHAFEQAQHYAAQGYWPMNETACHNFGGCEYRRVCAMPCSIRNNVLATDFVQDTWNPRESREV